MQKVHPGHDVLSLFGMAQPHQERVISLQRLALSASGAFLVVLAVSFALSLVTKAEQVATPATMSTSTIGTEPVAFEPGQFISPHITRGYLSR